MKSKSIKAGFLGIDIGGTWIKGTFVCNEFFESLKTSTVENLIVHKVKSPLHKDATSTDLMSAIKELTSYFELNLCDIMGVGISTAGIVDYSGKRVLKAAEHLNVLKNNNWKEELERKFQCCSVLINDADAASIGIAELGLLSGNKTVGIMPIGTGLGFSIWRNGRRWRPGKKLNLLGSINTPFGSFDSIASASLLACADSNHNLVNVLTQASLAKGELVAKSLELSKEYQTLETERPYQNESQLQNLSTSELVQLLWSAEQEAGKWLEKSLPDLEKVINEIYVRINKGGRIIYVGAGTSGRIASMDAVEIPCTYGFPEDRILCLIAGGVADASIEIESNFEEDASAVPELLLLNIKPEDVVIGISASGSAYYVQSALAVAKERGAYSVMIQSEKPKTELPFCNITIPLNSGYEVVAGSTRMKSGTATKKILNSGYEVVAGSTRMKSGTSTKKILNFISTSVMIKMGKVEGSYMIDVACINNKLIERAQEILKILFQMDKKESMAKLKKADMQLNTVIMNIKEHE